MTPNITETARAGARRGAGFRGCAATVLDRAQHDPELRALRFLRGDGNSSELSYGGLDRRARAIAASLSEVTSPGDRVVVACPSGLEFIAAFFGCLYAGVIAVPCPPPQLRKQTERLQAVAAESKPVAVLCDDANTAQTIGEALDGDGHTRVMICAQIPDSRGEGFAPSGHDVAFLQFTSGSTRTPRGVIVTHANLLANFEMIKPTCHMHDGLDFVHWLPVFHDMGLIGCLLFPLYMGGSATFMAPETFLGDPLRWLRTISASDRPVGSAAPNFALDLCAQRASEEGVGGLDLRHWESFVCGAEPVRRETVERFLKWFEPVGFRRSALHTAYGMAETTLLISTDPGGEHIDVSADGLALGVARPVDAQSGERATSLVSCGPAAPGCTVAVVDPLSGTEREEGEVGELWVRGPHVAVGYWDRPEESAATFGQTLPERDGGFLRTGDLGVCRGGRYYVTGRLKDVIIIRGRNLYPEDVEHAAKHAHELTRVQVGAAFAAPAPGEGEGGGEALVVVQGIPSGAAARGAEIAEAVRAAVMEACDVEPRTIVLTRSARIPRTTSGKVRRAQCRADWLEGRLSVLHQTGARSLEARGGARTDGPSRADILGLDPEARPGALRGWLSGRVAELARIAAWQVDAERPLPALGLDSLRFARLAAEIAQRLQVTLSGRSLSLDEICEEVASALADLPSAAPADPVAADAAPADLAPPAGAQADDSFPLTELQRAYLLGRSRSFELGGVSTHAYLEFDVSEFDLDALARAWWRLVERHEMLRAVITADGRQRILPADELDAAVWGIELADLGGLEPAAQERALHETRAAMSHELLDPHSGPLYRLLANRLDGGRTRLHFSLDLLIADLASIRLVLREWGTLYADPDRSLPAVRGGFPAWVRERVAASAADAPAVASAREYWRRRTGEMPPAPALPRLTAAGPPRFVRRCRHLGLNELGRLEHHARAHGVTVSVALLSAYAATLARWSRSRRMRLGVTRFDRPAEAPELNAVVGDFTSINVLAVDAGAPGSFAELAVAVQRRLWEDLAHGAFTGTQVLRELAAAEQSATGASLPFIFTSGIGVGASGSAAAWLGKLGWSVSQTPQVLLDHQVIPDDEGLLLSWDAVEAEFPPGALDAMFDAHGALLEALTEDGGWAAAALAPVPALDVEGQREANDTARSLGAALLHEPLLARARTQPDAPAIIAADRTLDFAELTARAHALAAELVALIEPGPTAQPVVGICLPKGWRQAVAALAILQTGAAYLPIDPQLPATRRRWLAEHAGCAAIIAGADSGPWPAGVGELAVPEGAPDGPVAAPAQAKRTDPGALAYVIYTSGSTGEPKGVAVSHRAASNTCLDLCERWGFAARDRALGVSALSFDLSVFDLFGVLGAGGALVLPEPEAQRDAGRWLDLIEHHEVTVWNSVPALAEMLSAEFERGSRGPLPLRLAMLSGDWIAPGLPARLRAAAPGVEVMSLGGATEAAIWSIAHPAGHELEGWDSVPYGRALVNQTVWVLDAQLEPCPQWVTGELYIGGAGLAEGYHRDPERTAERFLEHPRTGERLYRTGDLGRWREGGIIEFLGREDFQVKIGGHRIELGEIEHALCAHPGVRHAAVAVEGDRGARRLVAFAVRHQRAADPAPGGRPPAGGDALPGGDPVARGEAALAAAIGDGADVVADPLERLEFKLRRPGRRDPAGRRTVALAGAEPWWENGLGARASRRVFTETAVPAAALGGLLGALRSREDEPLPRYAYGSAGGLYPVQAYLQVRPGGVVGVDGGVYYHDPATHRLVALTGSGSALLELPGNAWAQDGPAFLLMLVCRRAAIAPLYGALSRDLCLLEAGLISQLLETTAPAHGLGLCQLGAARPRGGFATALELDDGDELLHVIAGGVPAPIAERAAAAGPVTVPALREHLATSLPAAMVPSTIVLLDELPLSPTGKVDRRALSALASRAPAVEPGGQNEPPADALEAAIAAEAAALLGLPRIAVTANFFDVGANSSLLVELYRRLRQRLDVDFALLTMFEYSNPRALAGRISGREDGAAAAQRGAARGDRRRRARRHRSPETDQEQSP